MWWDKQGFGSNRKGVRGQLLECEGNHMALSLGWLCLDRLQCRLWPHRATSLLDHQQLPVVSRDCLCFSHWLSFSTYKLYLRWISGGLIWLISPLSFLLTCFLVSYIFYSPAVPWGAQLFPDQFQGLWDSEYVSSLDSGGPIQVAKECCYSSSGLPWWLRG